MMSGQEEKIPDTGGLDMIIHSPGAFLSTMIRSRPPPVTENRQHRLNLQGRHSIPHGHAWIRQRMPKPPGHPAQR